VRLGWFLGGLFSSICAFPSLAERVAVLKQIDAPHPYYYREMYLPQLSSGPSSVTWSPDSQEVIYSMAGSLWRQRVGTQVAQQLIAAAGYDYQPDWSSDGRWVVYSTYNGESVELWVLELSSGYAHALTTNGAVNVEPRFSPDGKRLVFVSTLFNKRFHIFTADFAATGGPGPPALANIARLTGENKSALPRYYYSPFDHEINPVWSRDGREILYVSNRNHIYGTGGFWRTPSTRGGGASEAPDAREIHYEETNWKARPDFSPDGSRLVYSSYLGQSRNSLWLMPAAGGDAFPLGYSGERGAGGDQSYPRWSPDGKQIAFITNRGGNTELCIDVVPGGQPSCLNTSERHYLNPMTHLYVNLSNSGGRTAAARISITDSAGKFYAPANAWIHADDGIDRSGQKFEAHYFHATGSVDIEVPVGSIHVDIMRGFERKFESHEIRTVAGQPTTLAVNLGEGTWSVPDPGRGPDPGRWVSADVHVHMNYGGAYLNTPKHLTLQAQAENLSLVNALIVNKEQRFPDIAYGGLHTDEASTPDAVVVHGQEYHTSYWGHLGLLDIDSLILPGYVGYPNTAAASLYPMNADIADIAHARGALVGYVHPFDEEPQPVSKPGERLTNELPIDVALGKVDYMEILGFSDHRATAAVWYRLLNLGFRLPAAAGTDAMANFASLRGPVGMNRVYARVDAGAGAGAGVGAGVGSGLGESAIDPKLWMVALKAGRSFATNGPLLGFSLGLKQIGDELKFEAAQASVPFSVRIHSIVPVDHLELVCNGRVVKSFVQHKALDQGEFTGHIPLSTSGWCVTRASTDAARYPVLDNYVYATTSPIYIHIAGKPLKSPEDARYFAAWVDRVVEATTAYPDWNNAGEKQGVLKMLAKAKAVYVGMQ